ncbi:MAG: ABC transporter permease [Intestinimonas sp.]
MIRATPWPLSSSWCCCGWRPDGSPASSPPLWCCLWCGNVSRGWAETDPQRPGAGPGLSVRAVADPLRRVYVPSVLPYFASGCRTALGLAWKAGVAAEVLCLPKNAIGAQVYYAKIYLETPSLFAWTLAVIALSFLLEWAVGLLLRRLEGGGMRP